MRGRWCALLWLVAALGACSDSDPVVVVPLDAAPPVDVGFAGDVGGSMDAGSTDGPMSAACLRLAACCHEVSPAAFGDLCAIARQDDGDACENAIEHANRIDRCLAPGTGDAGI